MSKIREAIYNQDFTLANELINNDEDWNLDSFSASQIYQSLIKEEAFDVLKSFINKEQISLDVFEFDKFDNTIFGLLAEAKPTEKLFVFLDEIFPNIENIDEDLNGISWLAYSVQVKSSVEFLQKLIDAGCSVEWKNNVNQNLLSYTEDLEITQFLLNQGVNVNQQDAGGNTVLFKAIDKQNVPLIELYLQNGADCNIQNKEAHTPYHKVVFNAMSSEIFDLLNNYEPIRLDLKNNNDQSLLFEFAEKGQFSWENENTLLEKLLEQGADLFQVETTIYQEETTPARILAGKSYSLLEMISGKDGFNPNEQDNQGNTWLHYVCSENLNFDQQKAQELYKKVKLLLKLGANPEILNDQDKSAIDYAQDDDLKAKALTLLLKI